MIVEYNNGFVCIEPAYRDSMGVEHDTLVGPCACGAWHTKNDLPRDLPRDLPLEEV
jgi:hypothetical protein